MSNYKDTILYSDDDNYFVNHISPDGDLEDIINKDTIQYSDDDDYFINHISPDGDVDDIINEIIQDEEWIDSDDINSHLREREIQSQYDRDMGYHNDDDDRFDLGW